MRKTLASLLLLASTAGSILTTSPTPVAASVPDKPFTQTQCEGYSDSVEPVLGPFNEGRAPGYWRCGPSLTDSLLQLTDFPGGTFELAGGEIDEPADPNLRCDAAFFLPISTQFVTFEEGVSTLITQASYVAPTAHGAERYLEQVRQGLVECGSFINANGRQQDVTEVNLGSYGDDSIGLLLEYSRDGEITESLEAVIMRDGPVVAVIQNSAVIQNNSVVDTALTQRYATLLAERVAALSFT